MARKRTAKSGSSNTTDPRAEFAATAGLRIIGGLQRGRKLHYAGDPRTRPMKDRVREALFNLLGPRVKGKLAIDLFAGTGALGLEALSRGAERGVFLERHFPTAKLIRENAAAIGLEDRIDVVPGDTFIWARRELPAGGQWLVFCSPPYDFYVNRAEDMTMLFQRLASAAPVGSLFAIEADERWDMTAMIAALPQLGGWDLRAYPPAHVAIGEAGVA